MLEHIIWTILGYMLFHKTGNPIGNDVPSIPRRSETSGAATKLLGTFGRTTGQTTNFQSKLDGQTCQIYPLWKKLSSYTSSTVTKNGSFSIAMPQITRVYTNIVALVQQHCGIREVFREVEIRTNHQWLLISPTFGTIPSQGAMKHITIPYHEILLGYSYGL
jgi:hypothetical protein